ncbi:MAG: murein biosynthesis integral membrane protein MurJ [Treponema sp.]|nr:murein biosynthesis integral membrane protein MurJ [Treponema sp.]
MENSTEQKESPAGTPPAKKRGRSLVAKGLSLSFLTLASRLLGLIREMTKAKFLGTSTLSDAFVIAFQVPNFFRRLFAENSVSVAFIPTFKARLEDSATEEGKRTTQEFINATFTLVTFCSAVFVTLGMIFTPLILKIFFGKESLDALTEATVLTRIMFPYLVVISIAALLQGILNALKIFSPSGFTPILFNAIVIAFTYVLTYFKLTENPARAMAIGVITGGCVQAIFQLPFVFKNNWRIQFASLKKAFTNPYTKKVIRLIGPTIIGMAAYQINDIVSSSLATRAGTGVCSSLQYSLRLQELILGICAVTIGTVILPDLTGFAKKCEWDSFSKLLKQSVNIMTLISIPITFYSLVMAKNLITLVFATGKFNEDSILMTQKVFCCHILGLTFIAVNRIISPAFYAQGDTKSPTLAGLINFAVNISLALILVHQMSGAGIAIALSVASLVNTAFLFYFLRFKKNINVAEIAGGTFLYAVKIMLFSVIAVIPVYFLRGKIELLFAGHNRLISQGIPVALTALIFGAIGLALLLATKDPIVGIVLKKFRRK